MERNEHTRGRIKKRPAHTYVLILPYKTDGGRPDKKLKMELNLWYILLKWTYIVFPYNFISWRICMNCTANERISNKNDSRRGRNRKNTSSMYVCVCVCVVYVMHTVHSKLKIGNSFSMTTRNFSEWKRDRESTWQMRATGNDDDDDENDNNTARKKYPLKN